MPASPLSRKPPQLDGLDAVERPLFEEQIAEAGGCHGLGDTSGAVHPFPVACPQDAEGNNPGDPLDLPRLAAMVPFAAMILFAFV